MVKIIDYNKIVSLKSLFAAWNEFKKGKENKLDVQQFNLELEKNLIYLCREIQQGRYRHSKYVSFCICDPKIRNINKAEVADRILHHSIVRHIEPLFERIFIFDAYSSRKEKGTHRAVKRLQKFCLAITGNNSRTAWALKCDIRKFFDSIDHEILLSLVGERIKDEKTMTLIEEIVRSYSGSVDRGIPLGNFTSQLFSNVYLNKFDHFMKRDMGIKHYIRYADDFVILSRNREFLVKLVPRISEYIERELKLQLHPNKVSVRKIHKGVDFLGYVVFPTHILLRTKTKKRMLKKVRIKKKELRAKAISRKNFSQSLQSHFGILTHCRGIEIRIQIRDILKG